MFVMLAPPLSRDAFDAALGGLAHGRNQRLAHLVVDRNARIGPLTRVPAPRVPTSAVS